MSEWPGGIGGGDYDKRDVPIPEPKIKLDGTYRCSVCNQGFSTRQDYDDHYMNDHTKEKTEKKLCRTLYKIETGNIRGYRDKAARL